MFQTELRNELSLVAKLHFSVLRVCLKSFEFVCRYALTEDPKATAGFGGIWRMGPRLLGLPFPRLGNFLGSISFVVLVPPH